MTIDSSQSEMTEAVSGVTLDSTEQPPSLAAFVTYFAETQTNIPPGVRVVQPPDDTKQAIRGSLYAVVELFQDQVATEGLERDQFKQSDRAFPQKANVQEEVLTTIQRTYYNAKGTQTHVLTETLQAAYQVLDTHNAQQADSPLRIGVICVAFLKDQLVIATSGSALALVVTEKRIEQFPSTLEMPEDRQAVGQKPAIEVLRRQVHDGAVFFIGGGSWLEQLPIRTLASIVAHADVTHRFEAVKELRQLAQDGREEAQAQDEFGHAPALLVALGAASAQRPISESPYQQPFMPTARADKGPTYPSEQERVQVPDRSATVGLPTAINASPPQRSISQSDSPQAAPDDSSASVSPHASAIPHDISAPISSPQSGIEPTQSAFDSYEPMERIPDVSSESELGAPFAIEEFGESAPVRATPSNDGQAGPIQGGITGLKRIKDFWVDIFNNPNEQRANEQGASVQKARLQETNAKNRAKPFQMPRPARGDRARLYILGAVLIAFLVPVIATVMYLQNGADIRQQAEALIEQARVDIIDAQNAFDLGDKGTARTKLNEAQTNLEQAVDRIGHTPELNQLRTEVQAELQDVLQVTPLYGLVEPLALFAADASPHRLIVVDQDIYVLDTGREMLLRFQLDETRTLVSNPKGEIVLQEGSEIDGVRVGRLADIAWQEPVPGFEDKAHLIILDRNNQVFRYNQQVEGVTRLVFGQQESWQFPSQIQTYLGRIYITDEGSGEIYRYDPGNYGGEPMLWLDEQTHVNLAGLSSMRIDGDIWMLFDNGMILRYHQRIQVPFSLDSSINIVENPVDMFVDSQSTSFLYLADATQERILVYDKDGTYQYQFKAADGSPLRDLRGIFVDEVAGEMYLLTQSALFQHPLPR